MKWESLFVLDIVEAAGSIFRIILWDFTSPPLYRFNSNFAQKHTLGYMQSAVQREDDIDLTREMGSS